MTKRSRSLSELRSRAVSLSHHRRSCTICRHPDRDAIDEAFLQWRSLSLIKQEFQLTSRTSLYRHAHAYRLFARRAHYLRFALEHIIEAAECVTPTADAIIHAIKAYTRLNDAGEWIDPPSHVVVSSGSSYFASNLAGADAESQRSAKSASRMGLRDRTARPVRQEIRTYEGSERRQILPPVAEAGPRPLPSFPVSLALIFTSHQSRLTSHEAQLPSPVHWRKLAIMHLIENKRSASTQPGTLRDPLSVVPRWFSGCPILRDVGEELGARYLLPSEIPRTSRPDAIMGNRLPRCAHRISEQRKTGLPGRRNEGLAWPR